MTATTRSKAAKLKGEVSAVAARYVSRAVLTHLLLLLLTVGPLALQHLDILPPEAKPYVWDKKCFLDKGKGIVPRVAFPCIVEFAQANLVTLWTSAILILTASAAVYAGSWRSVKPSTQKAEDKPVAMSKSDAMRFPLMGSVVLLGLFTAIKFLPKELLTVCLSLYFALLGTFAISATALPFVDGWLPSSLRTTQIKLGFLNRLPSPVKNFLFEAETEGEELDLGDLEITGSELLCGLCSLAFCYVYHSTRHWVTNNVIGISFCIQGIEMLSLGSVQVGMILLSGLFFYDIFWVFFTPVMVTVAKSFNAPIKLLFIRSLAEDASKKPQFSMLGLGDIVIPGIYLALLLRMDHKRGFGRSNYFGPVFASYNLGLLATLVVMNVFQHAQPALLYLVPACLGATFYVALKNGEMGFIFNWSEVDEEEPAEAEGKKTK